MSSQDGTGAAGRDPVRIAVVGAPRACRARPGTPRAAPAWRVPPPVAVRVRRVRPRCGSIRPGWSAGPPLRRLAAALDGLPPPLRRAAAPLARTAAVLGRPVRAAARIVHPAGGDRQRRDGGDRPRVELLRAELLGGRVVRLQRASGQVEDPHRGVLGGVPPAQPDRPPPVLAPPGVPAQRRRVGAAADQPLLDKLGERGCLRPQARRPRLRDHPLPLLQHRVREAQHPVHRHPGRGGELLGGLAGPDPGLDLGRPQRVVQLDLDLTEAGQVTPAGGPQPFVHRQPEAVPGRRLQHHAGPVLGEPDESQLSHLHRLRPRRQIPVARGYGPAGRRPGTDTRPGHRESRRDRPGGGDPSAASPFTEPASR
jgi:hypothetical protein